MALVVVQPRTLMNIHHRCHGHSSCMLASAAGTVLVHEIALMRLCTMAGGGMLDFWTQSPPTDLPRCLPWVGMSCPDGSERVTSSVGDHQCVAPETFPEQLSVRFRQTVNCIPGVPICQVPSWLDGVWLWNSPELAAAALKLAQCLRVARQEVHAGVMVWTGDTKLQSFSFHKDGETWRRRLRSGKAKHMAADAWSRSSPTDRRRLDGMQNVELAWRIDSYRLSPSSPTDMLYDLLYRNGALLASCMGFPKPFLPRSVYEQLVMISDLEWTTSSSGPRLVQDPKSFNVSYKFEGVAQDQLPPAVIKDGLPPTPSPAIGLSTPAPGQDPTIAPVMSPTPTPHPLDVFAPRAGPATEESSIDGRPLLYAAAAVGGGLIIIGAVVAVCCFYRRWMSHTDHEIPTTSKASTKVPQSPRRSQTRPPERTQRSGPTTKHAWASNGSSGPPPHQWNNAPGGHTGPTPQPKQGVPRTTSAGPSTVLPVCPRITVDKSEPFHQQKELLAAELEVSLATEKFESRRRRFKDLCLRHHPDKNGDSEESKSLFQFLQAQRGAYLRD